MMAGNWHTVPEADETAHTLDADCPCGPTVHNLVADDGSTSAVITHQSFDGREGTAWVNPLDEDAATATASDERKGNERELWADAAWMARCARGSSWPLDMAQRVEDAANRVIAHEAEMRSRPVAAGEHGNISCPECGSHDVTCSERPHNHVCHACGYSMLPATGGDSLTTRAAELAADRDEGCDHPNGEVDGPACCHYRYDAETVRLLAKAAGVTS